MREAIKPNRVFWHQNVGLVLCIHFVRKSLQVCKVWPQGRGKELNSVCQDLEYFSDLSCRLQTLWKEGTASVTVRVTVCPVRWLLPGYWTPEHQAGQLEKWDRRGKGWMTVPVCLRAHTMHCVVLPEKSRKPAHPLPGFSSLLFHKVCISAGVVERSWDLRLASWSLDCNTC